MGHPTPNQNSKFHRERSNSTSTNTSNRREKEARSNKRKKQEALFHSQIFFPPDFLQLSYSTDFLHLSETYLSTEPANLSFPNQSNTTIFHGLISPGKHSIAFFSHMPPGWGVFDNTLALIK